MDCCPGSLMGGRGGKLSVSVLDYQSCGFLMRENRGYPLLLAALTVSAG